MKNVWLLVSAIGYAVTVIPMMIYSLETGNHLYWLDPAATTSLLFDDIGVVAFSLDLFFTVFVILILITVDSKKLGVGHAWMFWVLALLFGIAGTLPLYMHFRHATILKKGVGGDGE
jgi:hypothetical protein